MLILPLKYEASSVMNEYAVVQYLLFLTLFFFFVLKKSSWVQNLRKLLNILGPNSHNTGASCLGSEKIKESLSLTKTYGDQIWYILNNLNLQVF